MRKLLRSQNGGVLIMMALGFMVLGLPVVTVRPFNTYGPRQSARAIIPAITVQALLDIFPLVPGKTRFMKSQHLLGRRHIE